MSPLIRLTNAVSVRPRCSHCTRSPDFIAALSWVAGVCWRAASRAVLQAVPMHDWTAGVRLFAAWLFLDHSLLPCFHFSIAILSFAFASGLRRFTRAQRCQVSGLICVSEISSALTPSILATDALIALRVSPCSASTVNPTAPLTSLSWKNESCPCAISPRVDLKSNCASLPNSPFLPRPVQFRFARAALPA